MLTPQNYPTLININRSYLDAVAFFWFGKIQGKYKSKQVVSKLKKTWTK